MITSNADAEKTKPTAAKNTSAMVEQEQESESPDFVTKPHNLLNIVTSEDDEASQPQFDYC